MSIIMKDQSTIYGLDTNLLILTNGAAKEVQDRIAGDEATTAAVATAENTRATEVARVEAVVAENKTIAANETAAEAAARIAAINAITSSSTDGLNATNAALALETETRTTEVTEIKEDIANLITNMDPAALDSLTEIVGAFTQADEDINNAITALASDRASALAASIAAQNTINIALSAKDAEIVQSVTDNKTAAEAAMTAEATARTEADALAVKKAANLSDVADVPTARNNLNVMSVEETNDAIGAGGAVFTTEVITVAADTITLTNAPKNGIIFNFTCVRHTDSNGVSFDIPTTVTADTKVFNIHPNASGDFDNKTVTVQYAYAT